VFVVKETLNTRFTQLAELRNAIRHSRKVSDIAVKDGEARERSSAYRRDEDWYATDPIISRSPS
jgi:hypothetical protein